ncbi:PIR protein [Plasmodium ovale]|uniref:PIR protein n=1 Tax=Plasmodium ovale TaxID=36330 RepID=A0A1C3KEZ1_PLAOA|nr:PIR protein [Plasmodium ovale]
MTTAEPDYDVFDNAQEFFQSEDLIDDSIALNAHFCYTKKNDALNYNIQFSKLCNKFVKYFEKLRSEHLSDSTKYKKYSEYLNYWIAYKLRVTGLPDDLNPKFYELLKNNYTQFAAHGELYNKIYQIKEQNFKNMDIIYTLYRKYYELKANDDSVCQKFYDKYKENYNLAVDRCYTTDEKLCKPLEKFVHFYKVNRSYKLHMCSREGLPLLPNFVTSKPSDGINFIDKLAYYLYQLSSKQTKDTLSIISNTKYPNLVKLLSLNYNLLLYSNEQERKDNMMKILHEFIKFCKDKNTTSSLDSLIKNFFNSFYGKKKGSVPFLNLFIKEFFQDFYQKEKIEYELIFDECYTNTSQKSYCSKYEMCNKELGKDLFTIKDKLQEHIEYKPTPNVQLASKYSSVETPLHIEEEEDIVSSNTTPINVGVGVGALFTLSFLYKFTPLGSWVNRTFLGRGNTMYNYEEENDQDFFDHNSGFDNYISENNRFNVAYGAS